MRAVGAARIRTADANVAISCCTAVLRRSLMGQSSTGCLAVVHFPHIVYLRVCVCVCVSDIADKYFRIAAICPSIVVRSPVVTRQLAPPSRRRTFNATFRHIQRPVRRPVSQLRTRDGHIKLSG